MRIGILALALIFLLSGVKNLQNSRIMLKKKDEEAAGDAGKTEAQGFSRRQLGFGILLILVGILVLIYYFVT